MEKPKTTEIHPVAEVIIQQANQTIRLAFEIGFKCAEKGMNWQQAQEELEKLFN